MPPSVLIVPPALIALVTFMRRYYLRNPRRRITDSDFVGGAVSLGGALAYICLHGFQVGDPLVPWVCLASGWTMLGAAVVVSVRKPPVFEAD